MAATAPDTAWQASLFATAATVEVDGGFRGVRRTALPVGDHERHRAWVDHLPGWVRGSDVLFERVMDRAPWGEHTMEMYGERVLQPRLTAHWPLDDVPAGLDQLRHVGRLLSQRYRCTFTRVGCNLYRDGRDSVAWHGDRVARDLPTGTIAIVSLGHARPFRLRPRGGGASLGFRLGRGDLLVMGGSCQRTWQHTVPKVAGAGPRISVTFRTDYDD